MMAGRFFTVHEECGFRSSPCRSQAQADYAFRNHSCEKQARAAAAHQRGMLRHAAVDRTPKPCLHPRADHQHGTYACYTLDKCRCLPCSVASAEYERDRIKKHAYGRYDRLVDAGPVREHVRALMASGLGCKRIPVLAGVPVSTVNQLVFGKQRVDGTTRPIRRIQRTTAEALLALRPDPALLAGGVPVPSVGTHRRLQALVAIGWSQSELGRRLGIQPSNMTTAMQRSQVSAATARAVVRLYEELWNSPPPETCHRERHVASRARNFARRNGWVPPLAWDDDTIDDPAAEPVTVLEVDGALDEVLVERLMAGTARLPKNTQAPERTEAIRRLTALGLPDRAIADRVGMAAPAVTQVRYRNNITHRPGFPRAVSA